MKKMTAVPKSGPETLKGDSQTPSSVHEGSTSILSNSIGSDFNSAAEEDLGDLPEFRRRSVYVRFFLTEVLVNGKRKIAAHERPRKFGDEQRRIIEAINAIRSEHYSHVGQPTKENTEWCDNARFELAFKGRGKVLKVTLYSAEPSAENIVIEEFSNGEFDPKKSWGHFVDKNRVVPTNTSVEQAWIKAIQTRATEEKVAAIG